MGSCEKCACIKTPSASQARHLPRAGAGKEQEHGKEGRFLRSPLSYHPTMPDRPWKDEYTLLCEKCGYVIEGLDLAGNCPECGKPIAESLPERRVGTPWQQSPGVWSLVRTWWMTLRHPLRTLDVMCVGPESDWLLLFNIMIAVFYFSVGSGITHVVLNTQHSYTESRFLQSIAFFLSAIVFALPILFVLTVIEQQGLRLIARQRNFRIDHMSARAICSHATIGWITCLMLGSTSLMCVAAVKTTLNPHLDSIWWLLALLTFTPGFLFFETFAWLGLRRCKFANRERA